MNKNEKVWAMLEKDHKDVYHLLGVYYSLRDANLIAKFVAQGEWGRCKIRELTINDSPRKIKYDQK